MNSFFSLRIDFIVGLLLAFGLAFLGTSLVRRRALRVGRLDVPNHRSSHQVPTPRGGGLALVLVFLIGLAALFCWSGDFILFWFGLSVCLVALVGHWDDVHSMPVRYRFAIQVVGAAVMVYAVGSGPVDFGFFVLDLAWVNAVLAVLAVVWLLNLTNFMDGIDGIAGMQTVGACGVVCWLLYLEGVAGLYIALPALLAAVTLGFLVWNFPPAKIFMGDVASGTLGLLFGGFALWHRQLGAQWLFVWLIVLGVFVVDATYTLLARACRGKKLSQAHRSHAYQRAARQFGAHKPVTLAVLFIILFWLGPWAWAVAQLQVQGVVALLAAYTPLIALAYYFKAGMLDD